MPVGPEFQDPPKTENQAPYFVTPKGSLAPFYETAVTVSGMTMFFATVGDSNLTDTLTARWASNYPPYTPGASHVLKYADPSGDRSSSDHTWTFKLTVTCDDFKGGADHNLVVIISDDGLLDPNDLGVPTTSTVPYNYDVPNHSVSTMVGWRIVGCS